jgi:hypothetical protein
MNFEAMKSAIYSAVDRRIKKALVNTTLECAITDINCESHTEDNLSIWVMLELFVDQQKLRRILSQVAAQELLF